MGGSYDSDRLGPTVWIVPLSLGFLEGSLHDAPPAHKDYRQVFAEFGVDRLISWIRLLSGQPLCMVSASTPRTR